MTIAHISNNELGFDVRAKLNNVIDIANSAGAGTGDVVGPASAIADSVAVYNGVTGKLIKDGGQTIANIIASAVSASGAGDVVGPASAVADHIAIYNGVTGKLIKDGGQTIAQVIAAAGGGGGGMAIGGAITGATAGRVLFAGVGGILDDDSTFKWNDTLKDLAIGGAYYVNAARALYVVPHVSGNNWFEGSAGNSTLTGYSNFGTGDLALASITTGYENTAIGTQALQFCTDGHDNTAIGFLSLQNLHSGTSNFALGAFALNKLESTGGTYSSNVAIGYSALLLMQKGGNNVAIGTAAGGNITSGTASNQILIGSNAGNNLGSGGAAISANVMIGPNCGQFLSAGTSNATWFGGYGGVTGDWSNTIEFSAGSMLVLDWNYTLNGAIVYPALTLSAAFGAPAAFHLYNNQDVLGPNVANYERAILDWRPMSNVFRIGTQKGGSGVLRLVAIDGFAKAGAPAAGDLPASSFAVIDDTSANKTWLAFNKAGTIRQTEIGGAGGGGSMAIGGSITSATAGSVLFAGAAGVLAQDNTHFNYDPATNYLKLGSTGTLGIYYLNGLPGLYVVPNASGNNWFEGNAGNFAATGYGNFGTGDGVMANLTTGNGNVGLGGVAAVGGYSATMRFLTTGSNNLAVGASALMNNTTGDNNVAIGNQAMALSNAAIQCVALGRAALNVTGQSPNPPGYANVGIGDAALTNLRSGQQNVGIGASVLALTTDGQSNTIIGDSTASNLSGSNSMMTWVGSYLGPAAGTYVTDTIVISGGRDNPRPGLDRGLTQPFWYGAPGNSAIWSFNTGIGDRSIGLHLYKTEDSIPGPVNYERAILDWNETTNVFTIGCQKGGTGTLRLTAFIAYPKAGAPAAADLPSGTFAVIDDTSGGATWLVFNKAGAIRKVQLT